MKKALFGLVLSFTPYLTSNVIDTWDSPAQTISSTGVDASNPCLGTDSSGNAVAAWIEGGFLVSRSKLVSGSWDSLATLSSSGASSPQLVVDSSGNATAVWVEAGSIKTADKPFGGSWSSATSLSLSSSSQPQIAVQSNGDLVAVWVEGTQIKSSTKLFGGSWSLVPDTLSGAGADSPQVAIGDNGSVFVVWHAQQAVTFIDTIYSTAKSISGLWSSATTISNLSENSVSPQVAVDSSGNAVVLWFRYDLNGSVYSNVTLQSSFWSSNDLLWSTIRDVSFPGSKNPQCLVAQVKYAPNGVALAAWTNSYDGITFYIETAQTDPNLNWLVPVTIDYNQGAYSFSTAVDSANFGLGTYMSYDSGSSSLIVNYVSSHLEGVQTGIWSFPFTLSSGGNSGYPLIATAVPTATSSLAVAAWRNFDGSNNVIQAITGSGTLTSPPTGLSVIQQMNSFGIVDEYYNTLSWSASPSPNISGYAVFRDNLFLTIVDSNTLDFVDNNQEQNGSVTYSVLAIDDTGSESESATVTFP